MGVYSDAILQDNPFIYWKLDETSGSTIAVDSSGNSNNGTYSSGLTFEQTSLVVGDAGTSILKTSNNGYVYTSAFAGITVKAMEAWFTTSSIVNNAAIASIHQASNARVILVTNSANRLSVYSGSSGSIVMYQDDASLELDQTYHCVLFYNSSDDKTYMMLNGVMQSSYVSGNLMAQVASVIFYAAAYNYGSIYSYLRGYLDEMSFYTDEVSESRFARHYVLGANPYYFSGYVYERSVPVSRSVRLYRRDDGAFMNSTTSSGNGYYYITTTYSGEHYIVAIDDDIGYSYNAAILDKMTPYIIGE